MTPAAGLRHQVAEAIIYFPNPEKFIVAVLVLLSAIYLTHPLYLKALGNLLVVSDPLVKADAIVVLDGDPKDERLLHSVQLWQSGYAPKVILSAPLARWQTYEDYPSWRH